MSGQQIYKVSIFENGKLVDTYNLAGRELSMLAKHKKHGLTIRAWTEDGEELEFNQHGVFQVK